MCIDPFPHQLYSDGLFIPCLNNLIGQAFYQIVWVTGKQSKHAFAKPVKDGEFEWTAVMLNINKGHNTELLHKCEILNEYSLFIGKIKEDIKAGAEMEEAVNDAVDWAVGNDILSDYLLMHKSEVVGMLLTEYDEKRVWENFKKDVYEEGREEGREESRAVIENLQAVISDLRKQIEELSKNKK